jgi:hypothetical protein
MTHRTPWWAGTLLAVVAVMAACSAAPQASPTQEVCDGISDDMGGCTTERHQFTGSTCADLAREWVTVLDPAVLAILDGPAGVNSQARSSRLKQVVVITTLDMNTRLRALDLQADCDVPEFMAVAVPLFSEKVRSGAGSALWDGNPPATFEEWLDDVSRTLRVIDDGESPAPSS